MALSSRSRRSNEIYFEALHLAEAKETERLNVLHGPTVRNLKPTLAVTADLVVVNVDDEIVTFARNEAGPPSCSCKQLFCEHSVKGRTTGHRDSLGLAPGKIRREAV